MFRVPPFCVFCLAGFDRAMDRHHWGHWRELTGDGGDSWQSPLEDQQGPVAPFSVVERKNGRASDHYRSEAICGNQSMVGSEHENFSRSTVGHMRPLDAWPSRNL